MIAHGPCRTAALVAALLLLPSPLLAAGLDLSGLRWRSQACLETGDRQPCSLALQESHRLKDAAEARHLLRCYTALLAVEALLIADRLRPEPQRQALASGFAEAGQVCEAPRQHGA